jgi:hypothetical protein
MNGQTILTARLRASLPVLALTLTAAPARAEPPPGPDIQLIGVGALPGTTRDGLELEPKLLEDGVTPHDLAGGWGSGITYTGVGNLYLAVPDRGPADGTTSYLDRAYLLDIPLTPGGSPAVQVSLRRATLLTSEDGQLLTGSAAAFDATNSPAGRRLDPEAVRLTGTGGFYVSDEYGPFLYEFGPFGERRRVLDLPARFKIAGPRALAADELPPTNTSGRQANRGMEGLAVTPDGHKLFGLMQNALIQDGALEPPPSNRRIGLNTRLLEVDARTGATREYVYVLDNRGNGLNEILAINDDQFLVIERDGDAGVKAARKRIYKVDLAGASDVSAIDSLPTAGLPEGVEAVKKTLLIDLLDPAFGLAGPAFPEKIEGLAFGPWLDDGRISLLVTSDNDFKADQPSRVFAFAIAPHLLAYHPQRLRPEIDIAPGASPAIIRVGRPGTVPVVVFGSPLLPVDRLDPWSFRMLGAPVVERRGRLACSRVDHNGDGDADLVCHFDRAAMQTSQRLSEVRLEGQTDTGTPIEGVDEAIATNR